MKKLTPDQWLGAGLALMAFGVLSLSVLDMKASGTALTTAKVGVAMPPLSGESLDGTPIELAAGDSGGSVLLVDFWATWCPPCIREMPILESLHAQYERQGVRLIAVNGDTGSLNQRRAVVEEFLLRQGLKVPVLLDDGGSAHTWGIQAFPTLVLVGRDGQVRETFSGLTSRSRLAEAIESALDADSSSPRSAF